MSRLGIGLSLALLASVALNAIPVIALMTAGTNVVSIVGGLLVFGDPLGRRPALILVHIAAFALVALGSWLLAPAQAAVTVGAGSGPRDPAAAA